MKVEVYRTTVGGECQIVIAFWHYGTRVIADISNYGCYKAWCLGPGEMGDPSPNNRLGDAFVSEGELADIAQDAKSNQSSHHSSVDGTYLLRLLDLINQQCCLFPETRQFQPSRPSDWGDHIFHPGLSG